MNGLAPNPISQALAAGVVARRLAKRGDVHMAVGLLCQALQLAPEAPLIENAESWLTVDNLRRLGPSPLRRLALAIAKVAQGATGHGMASNGRTLNLRAGARVLRCGRACFPDEGKLYVGEAFVRGKLGDAAGKALVAREAAQHFPYTWTGHGVMLALTNEERHRSGEHALSA